MLNLFCFQLGIGRCFYYKKNEDTNTTIIWSESNKDGLIKIFEILNDYPPLTKIKREQLEKAQQFFFNRCINTYKNLIFDKSLKLVDYYDRDKILNLPYFSEWLSGFIEAEGSFYLDTGRPIFNIYQNDELGIILAIKEYFNISSSVIINQAILEKQHYRIQTSKKTCINNICNHISKYPLLGQKYKNFNEVIGLKKKGD